MPKREKPEYLIERAESIEERAKDAGCVALYPTARELFIDIDSDADYHVFEDHIETLTELWPNLRITHDDPSRNGGEGRHIVVTLPEDVTELERAALQAVLGSDRKRELLTIMAHFCGINGQTVFFEKKAD